MKPITDDEYKAFILKYRIRSPRNNRTDEILAFVKEDAAYAELQRFLPVEKIKQERASYATVVWKMAKAKIFPEHYINVHVCGDRIVAEKKVKKEA